MLTGEVEEEEGASGGMEGGRGGLELFKDKLSFRDLVFLQDSKRDGRPWVCEQLPEAVCFILEIVLLFQLP